jgi:hypothetical protein
LYARRSWLDGKWNSIPATGDDHGASRVAGGGSETPTIGGGLPSHRRAPQRASVSPSTFKRGMLNSFGARVAVGHVVDLDRHVAALQFRCGQLYSYAHRWGTGREGRGNGTVVEVVAAMVTGGRLAVRILFMTIVAANLPGLLEISCLRWLPIDQIRRRDDGRSLRDSHRRHRRERDRRAMVERAVARGAMTVGLGFGLQEIFANSSPASSSCGGRSGRRYRDDRRRHRHRIPVRRRSSTGIARS